MIYRPPVSYKDKLALLGDELALVGEQLDKDLAAIRADVQALKDQAPSTGPGPLPPTTTTTTTAAPTTTTTTTVQATTTTTTTAKPPSYTSGLPDVVQYNWHHCWKGPLPWAGYPSDVQDKLNFAVLGLAQSAGAGTGRLGYYNRFGGSLKPSILAAAAKGKRTVMGIGGSSDGGITIQNDTQVNEAFNSYVGFVDQYGISGMDIDLEPSGSHWNASSLVKLADRLLDRYPDFIIGITPGLYGDYTARWLDLARQLGNRYQYMAPMLYDFSEAGTSALTGVALQKCQIMRDGGVPEDKMILGFMTLPDQNYRDAQGRLKASTVAITQDAYNACKQRYPRLRGAFHWEDGIDAAHNWAWSRGFRL